MEVVLHVGAHRTATTSFQACLRRNGAALGTARIVAWEPRKLRGELLQGLRGCDAMPGALERARERAQLRMWRAAGHGARTLLMSEENMLGAVRPNVRARALYPDAGHRLARYAALMRGRVSRVVLSIRALDTYWASALAYAVARGHALPGPAALDQIAHNPRSWVHVVRDIAAVLPQAEIVVVPFERVAGRPQTLLRVATGQDIALEGAEVWANRAPNADALHEILRSRGNHAALGREAGRWQPFTPVQIARLREVYADDMAWLSEGADGLASLTEDRRAPKRGTNPRGRAMTRGQDNDGQDGEMAQTG